jgi:hypothetical protein
MNRNVDKLEILGLNSISLFNDAHDLKPFSGFKPGFRLKPGLKLSVH